MRCSRIFSFTLTPFAGAPIQPEILAAVLDRQEIADAINHAFAEGLLVRANIREVDVAHEKVGAAILARLEAPRREAIHGRLAAALMEFDAAPDLLIEHLCAAGQRELALGQAVAAAEQAAVSLAFGRAIHFYRRSLGLLEADSPDVVELRHALVEQLANDGRGPEASRLYVEVAASCTDAAEAREFRRQAALLLLSSGRLRQGLGLLRGVLRELGEALPRAPLGIAVTLAYERQRVALAWSRWQRGPRSSVPMDDQTREIVETLLVAVRGLGAEEHVLTYRLQSRALCLALAHAPKLELAILVGAEALNELARGRARQSRDARAEFDELATRFTEPEFEVLHQGFLVLYAFLELDFDAVLQDGPRVWARLASYPTQRWFRALLSGPLAFTWLYTGDFNTVRRECQRWRLAAIERGNLQHVVQLSSSLAIVSLYTGGVERARALLDEVEDSIEATLFSMSTAAARTARALALTYEGRHDEASALSRATFRQARRSGLLRIRVIRCVLEDVRGRCELARLVAAGVSPSLIERGRIARRIAWLQVHGETMGHGFAAVLRAGLASLDGSDFEVYGAWREAELAFSNCGFDAHQAAVRRRLGELGQDPGSEALRNRALRYFEAQGVGCPHRFVDLLAPARFDSVEHGLRRRRARG